METKEFLELLKDNGIRLTEPRMKILQCLPVFQTFSGEEIYDHLADQGVGRATVFRTLRLLGDRGLIYRVQGEGAPRYQLTPRGTDHGHQIVCRGCGRSEVLSSCPLTKAISEVAETSGYQVEGHHLEIFGLCKGCQGPSS